MTRTYTLFVGAVILAVLTFVGTSSTGQADDDNLRTYRVTIENETDSQPFSPGVAITHRRSARLFRVGDEASPGVEAIAEDGDQGPAVAAAMSALGVTDFFDINRPITREGTTAMGFMDEFSFEIQARPRDRLSLAVMLICTNDGFTGLESVKLPKDEDDPVTFLAAGYDAGTEDNTEESEDIVDPCSGLGPASLAGDPNGNEDAAVDTSPQGNIHHHPGIQGGADLSPAAHNWMNPVAKITVELLDDDEDYEDDD